MLCPCDTRYAEGVSLWKVPQKITAHRAVTDLVFVGRRRVRVKMCGKSAQVLVVTQAQGKPHQEQDKTVCAVVRSA